jgi:ABC-type lipoprotein export system ATPase subunit
MQQKVALAGALLQLVIADEPLSDLDRGASIAMFGRRARSLAGSGSSARAKARR